MLRDFRRTAGGDGERDPVARILGVVCSGVALLLAGISVSLHLPGRGRASGSVDAGARVQAPAPAREPLPAAAAPPTAASSPAQAGESRQPADAADLPRAPRGDSAAEPRASMPSAIELRAALASLSRMGSFSNAEGTGMQVDRLRRDSALARVGLRPGDRITDVDGAQILSTEQGLLALAQSLAASPAGTTVVALLRADGSPVQISIQGRDWIEQGRDWIERSPGVNMPAPER